MSKKKKEKIIYYDDGSTIADMSGVGRNRKPKETKKNQYIETPRQSKWQTYWSAVRMMIVPMFVALGILAFLFFMTALMTGAFS